MALLVKTCAWFQLFLLQSEWERVIYENLAKYGPAGENLSSQGKNDATTFPQPELRINPNSIN